MRLLRRENFSSASLQPFSEKFDPEHFRVQHRAMQNLRRNRLAYVLLALVALVGSIVAGALPRVRASSEGVVVDSVLGALVICHQVANEATTEPAQQPGTPSFPQHDCPACLADSGGTIALAEPDPAGVTPPLRVAEASRLSANAPIEIAIAHSGSLGSRAPPSSR